MSRSTLSRIALLTAVVLSTLTAAEPDQPVRLERKFATSQVNFYVVEREETVKTMLMGLEFPVSRSMTDTWIESVRDLSPDGSASLEWTLDRVQYQRPDGRTSSRYDSVSDEPPPELRAVAALLHRPIPTTQCRAGDVLAASDAKPFPPPTTQRISQPATASSPTTHRAATPPAAQNNALHYDQAELIKLLARLTAGFLPSNPVSPGDAWNMQFTESKAAFGTLVHRLRFTLRDVTTTEGRAIATIAVEGDCELGPPEPSAAHDKSHRRVEVRHGRWSGEIRFDAQRGRLVTLSLRHENDVVLAQSKDGMDIEVGNAEARIYRVRALDQLPPKPIVVKPNRPPLAPYVPPPAATTTSRPVQAWRSAAPPATRPMIRREHLRTPASKPAVRSPAPD